MKYIISIILCILLTTSVLANNIEDYDGVYKVDDSTYDITKTIVLKDGDSFLLRNKIINSYVDGPTFYAEDVEDFVLEAKVWLVTNSPNARVLKLVGARWNTIPYLKGYLLYPNQMGIEETTPKTTIADDTNSMHNAWGQIAMYTTLQATNSIGWEMTSQSPGINGVCWDTITSYIFAPSHRTQIGLKLGCADTNTFTLFGVYGNKSIGVSAIAVVFDNNCHVNFPNNNKFVTTDSGISRWINIGVPGVIPRNLAKNKVLSFGKGNGAITPYLPNLEVK